LGRRSKKIDKGFQILDAKTTKIPMINNNNTTPTIIAKNGPLFFVGG